MAKTRKCSEVADAIEYIKANFDRAVKVSEIAGAVHLSESRLAHLFTEQVGESPIEYLMQMRIDHAKSLLKTTKLTCGQVSEMTGYARQSCFSRVFKSVTGTTPRQYRIKHRD